MVRNSLCLAASLLALTAACSDEPGPPLGGGGAGGTATSSGVTRPSSRWLQIDSGTSLRLNAVWAHSETAVWAVGDGVIAHYDGFDWIEIDRNDLPNDAYSIEFHGVSGTGPNDVWVSGAQGQANGPVLLHWDGSRWSSELEKNDAVGGESYVFFAMEVDDEGLWIADGTEGSGDGGHGYFLDGLGTLIDRVSGEMRSVAIAGDAVFFGEIGGDVMHYDGSEWSAAGLERKGLGDDMLGVYAFGAEDVWAVGPEKRVHFDGSTWEEVDGEAEAYDVWGAASDDVWVVGESFEHYDGTTWTISLPPRDVIYRGVHGTSATDIWAVGDDGAIAHFGG